MIPRAHITSWRAVAPWSTDAQVEQDLILSRALIEIFSNSELASRLAFRGGTALHKLLLNPATRYSEDIDLVQLKSEAIGPAPGSASHNVSSRRVEPQLSTALILKWLRSHRFD